MEVNSHAERDGGLGGTGVAPSGEARTFDLVEVWPSILRSFDVSERDAEVITASLPMSERQEDGYAYFEPVWVHDVFAAMGRPASGAEAVGFYNRTRAHLMEGPGAMSGGVLVRPTYSGIVRATKKAASEMETLIAQLEKKWELPNVDFKRELTFAGSPSERETKRAEFVKDILALATSQTEGDRYYVIGWDPNTQQFCPPGVDPALTEEQMQQILESYCDPTPAISYTAHPHKGGLAGIIQVLREPKLVPYRVSRDIGRHAKGDMFVRHGTVTSHPSRAEVEALEREALRAADPAENN